MRGFTRLSAFLLLAACGAPDEPPPVPAALVNTSAWFVCQARDEPVFFVASRPDAQSLFTLAQFDVRAGRFEQARDLSVGAEQTAAAQVVTPLLEDEVVIGAIRSTAEPDSSTSWTEPVEAVVLGERTIACAPAERTRLIGLNAEETVSAHRDSAGALILTRTPHDGDAPTRIAGGVEEVGRDSITLLFDQGDDRFILYAPETAALTMHIWRNGERADVVEYPVRVIGDDPAAVDAPVR